MKRWMVGIAALLMFAAGLGLARPEGAPRPPALNEQEAVRFEAIDVFIDSGETPLAAYQFELRVIEGEAVIVGLEGGAHAAFADAPYYDPAALQSGRVIVAGFNTSPAAQLPSGRTHIARVHWQISGNEQPQFEATVMKAASPTGEVFQAGIDVEKGAQP